MRTRARTPLRGLAWAAAALVTGYVAGHVRARGADPASYGLNAREQAALRRVTTLAARGVSAAEIFDAVAGEMGRIAAAENMIIGRYEPDDTFLILASWSARGAARRLVPVGSTWVLYPDGVGAEIRRTGRPAQVTYTAAQLDRMYGDSTAAREQGIRSGVGWPIVVEGRQWGVLETFSTAAGPLPEGVEKRMAAFLEFVAAAIANAESRAELAASRARVVAAADAGRRQVERDLHDGAQQRIVRLMLWARAAEAVVPADQDELRTQLMNMTKELTDVLEDLREISRGLHPAVLSRGGLGPALSTLARRSVVPVELDVHLGDRLADNVEVAVYHFVSEALSNTAKHARASLVRVEVRAGDEADGRALNVTIRDDGAGGADLGRGSGLIGLRDRVEALDGRLEIASPPGGGTTLVARIPIGHSLRPPRDG